MKQLPSLYGFWRFLNVAFYENKHQVIIGQLVDRQYVLKGHQQIQIEWFGFLSFILYYTQCTERWLRSIMWFIRSLGEEVKCNWLRGNLDQNALTAEKLLGLKQNLCWQDVIWNVFIPYPVHRELPSPLLVVDTWRGPLNMLNRLDRMGKWKS